MLLTFKKGSLTGGFFSLLRKNSSNTEGLQKKIERLERKVEQIPCFFLTNKIGSLTNFTSFASFNELFEEGRSIIVSAIIAKNEGIFFFNLCLEYVK